MERAARAASLAAFLLIFAFGAPVQGADRVSFVPWKVLDAGAEAGDSLFVLYWIPASPEEMRRSDLLTSRVLAVFSTRCVAMRVVRVDDEERIAALGIDELPAAVLMTRGVEIARAGGDGRILRTADVESMVRASFDAEESAAQTALDRGYALVRSGDTSTATEMFRRVTTCRCAFPKLAKRAQRELNRLR